MAGVPMGIGLCTVSMGMDGFRKYIKYMVIGLKLRDIEMDGCSKQYCKVKNNLKLVIKDK
jgi:hypothetical protein